MIRQANGLWYPKILKSVYRWKEKNNNLSVLSKYFLDYLYLFTIFFKCQRRDRFDTSEIWYFSYLSWMDDIFKVFRVLNRIFFLKSKYLCFITLEHNPIRLNFVESFLSLDIVLQSSEKFKRIKFSVSKDVLRDCFCFCM